LGVAVRINGQEVGGLEAMSAATAPSTYVATAGNQVLENDVVTLHTSTQYSGFPSLLRVKMIFTIQ
jgi:hypothetical protein